MKYKDKWRLFDLKNDPGETKDIEADNPEVASNMRKHYDAFVASLPPLKKGADDSGNGRDPEGWRWVVGDGNMSID